MRSVRQERGGERVEAARAHDAGHTSGAERPDLFERCNWLHTADGAPENGLHLKRGLGLRAAWWSDPRKNDRTRHALLSGGIQQKERPSTLVGVRAVDPSASGPT